MPVVQAASTGPGSGSDPQLRQPIFRLPAELVNQAATRLCWISNLFAVTTVGMILVQGSLQPEVRVALESPVLRLAALVTLFLTLGFIAAHRFAWFSKETLLRLGLVFEVLVAFYISFFETSIPRGGDHPVRGVSTVALWITLVGLLIPNTPWAKLASALASVCMWLLAYYVNVTFLGAETQAWNRVAVWIFPMLVATGWTFLFNKRLFKMHMDSKKAEDLGSYQLDFMIGKGGMGEVWRARHKMLQRDAAIKIIRPEVLNAQSGRLANTMRRRFEKEAKATASLRSPHTVALYDFGMARDASFYYVMELLDGIDLQTMVERFGPLDPGRVARMLVQICDSLEEAHRAGMVHRDIKPQNMFACRLGQNYDFVKVLDFGLVKTMAAENATLMTMEGQATGTPAYMAPEVAMGADNVDQRADLYGLGCVAYFLLTGQLVFNEPTPTALALAHVQKAPVAPSERVETRIPASLERLVLSLLEKDPDKRPRSAQEVVRTIEEASDLPAWTRSDSLRWWMLNLPENGATPAALVRHDSNDTLATSSEKRLLSVAVR